MYHQGGKPLTPSEKRFIISAKLYFDRNRPEFGIRDSAAQMTADALGVGLASVNRVVAEYNKDPESVNRPALPRGRPRYVVSDTHEEAVRAFIRQGNREGRPMTLELIKDFLVHRDSNEESFHLRTLANTLDRWGFEFGRCKRTQGLKEKDYVVALRRRYLRIMRANRSVNGSILRPEVYLDESYINKNHSKDFTWFWREDGPWVQKPTGKGERLIIVNAITKDGWVPNAKLVFKSTRKTGDYHGQMNWNMFRKWFVDSLLPNIPKGSLIILDNAAYHNVLASYSAPTVSCTKEKIFSWLANEGIPCREDCLKAELVEILQKFVPSPTYALDELAREQGHEVVRTPPYHPELQPIEVCWGVTKNEVARYCDFTMKGLQEKLEKAFHKVTSEICKKIIEKVRSVEDIFWEEDLCLEENSSL